MGFMVVLVALFGMLLYLYISSRKKALRVLKDVGIPGPEPSLLFGNMNEIRPPFSEKLCYQIPVLEKWAKKYGRVFGYYSGLRPRIIVTDVDMIRQIFVKESNVFTNRASGNKSNHSVLDLKDQRWKNTRRVLTPTFSAHKLKQMLHLMESCDETLMSIIEEKRKQQEDIEVFALLQDLTMDVIFKCALAMDMDCQRKQNSMVQALKDFFNFNITILALARLLFPATKHLMRPIVTKISPQQKVFSYLNENLKEIIRNRRSLEDNQFRDVLQLLLEAASGKHEEERKKRKLIGNVSSETDSTDSEDAVNSNVNTDDDKNKRQKTLLTDKEIIDNSIVFLLAGYETTSNALSYTLYCLAKHPEVQEKIWEELDRVIADKPHVTYEELAKLVYLDQVFCESMRVFPPVVAFVHRKCKKTIEIGNWTIPKGSVVEAPVWLLHHDPEYWPNPERFDPDRFSPKNKTQQQQMAFCPFGIGPRKCIGERFALLEAKLCLAKVLKKYKILPSAKNQEPLPTIVRTVIMNPKEGIWVKMVPRDT